MSSIPHEPIKFQKKTFNCLFCSAYSTHDWLNKVFDDMNKNKERIGSDHSGWLDRISSSQCNHCKERTYWLNGTMLYPEATSVELVNPDMPEECQHLYQEAASVLSKSPRASVALLRLCVQKLMPYIGGKGKNINTDIEYLVKQGLHDHVQQALDACRVIGNNAVHPGEIQIEDDPNIAISLFMLLNFIVNEQITKPNQVKSMFDRLPVKDKENIKKRDKKENSEE